MRPLDDRERRKSARVARARVCLKTHLDWLDGFPVSQSHGQLKWMLRPRIGLREGRTVTIDRDTLRRATIAVSRLTTQHAGSTRTIVGDVMTWQDSVSSLLESLKTVVHEHQDRLTDIPLECLGNDDLRTVLHLKNRFPELHEFLRAIVWSHWTQPEKRSWLLSWASDNAESLAAYVRSIDWPSSGPVLLLFADLILANDSGDLGILQQILYEARDFDVTNARYRHEANSFIEALKKWHDPQNTPMIPVLSESDFHPVFIRFLNWLTDQKPPQRRIAVRMLNLAMNPAALQKWRDAWQQFDQSARATVRSLQSLAKRLPKVEFQAESCRTAVELSGLLSESGPIVVPAELLNAVRSVVATHSLRFCETLCDFVAAVPASTNGGRPIEDGCLLRMALVTEVSVHSGDEIPEKKWIRFHQLATRFLKDNRESDRVLSLWSGLIAAQWRHGYLYSQLRGEVFTTLDDEKRWPEYFECLHLLQKHEQFSEDCTDVIAWLVNQSTGVAQVCERFSHVAKLPWLHDCVGTQILSALKLETDGFPLAELLELIGPPSRMDSERLPDVVNLHQHFLRAGWPDVLPFVLRSKRITEVTQLSVLLAISSAFPDGPNAVPRPENPQLPEWAADLPEELHASIACFCSLPDANPKNAQNIVARHFPAKDDLQNEIAALERRTAQDPEDAHRSARLQNLKRRLTNPDPVSINAVQRLRRKLDEAIVRHVFRDFRDRVLSSIRRVLHARIGGQRVCRELSVPRHLELVSSLLRQEEPWRELGLRLLLKCWGDDDWDQAREPANERFLQSLEVRGIRVAPWLQPRSVRISAEGHRYRLVLGFAENEVETMLMGHYFGTCLSPDGVNFFSAVANAIDVNKRVVYLRTVGGDVVGRCLLVLGDSGTLMTYHPYCNDEKIPFSGHMAEFAANLAAEMGTVVSHNDTVATLVAPEWYDDGAHDLGNSVFSETSPLRVAIRAGSEDNILSATEQACGVVGLSDTLLELIVELPEFESRPALIRPFIPCFERRETQLGVASVIQAALLAFQAGEREFANGMLLKHGPGWIVRHRSRGNFDSVGVQILRALTEIHPSKALRILRETRHRTVRSDAEEVDETRRELLADCFKALARPRLAAELRK